MKCYKFVKHDIAGPRYPWASGYGPVENMPFLEFFSKDWQETKLASWKLNKTSPGISIDLGGREWSDILGCGNSPPGEFFSERVVNDLLEEGIPFLRSTEMPITKITSKKLKSLTPPRYYVIEASPGLEIWSESVPVEVQIAARNEIPRRWIGPYLTKSRLETWNGADLFSPSHGKSLTALFCTERVKELAERKGWTNAKFMPIEVIA